MVEDFLVGISQSFLFASDLNACTEILWKVYVYTSRYKQKIIKPFRSNLNTDTCSSMQSSCCIRFNKAHVALSLTQQLYTHLMHGFQINKGFQLIKSYHGNLSYKYFFKQLIFIKTFITCIFTNACKQEVAKYRKHSMN